MSLRDRLLNRPRPTGSFPLRVDDDTAARDELERARRLHTMLLLQGGVDESALEQARTDVREAEERLRDCFEFVTLRAVSAADFEALVTAHPPRPDTKDEMYNLDTFPKACFLACVEGELSQEEWERLWDTGLSNAEQIAAGNAAIRVNIRTPDESLPKGWERTEPSG
ncbi:unnamed protein product [[Actinomadura] parvosata subsp. kistnae]|uniref:Uncharacterized protein n=1 Tax=[Actinomadura] parvosata subsp. kistnae TaxID=1909395 RepID=A0A1V0ABN7_9ACTN|nr:hypothetical protein [Nonomuraea sp. ATCC 55076]AQZ67640.1 hypothetical protein BKM31_44785 [Nonomuraea sp. ATCC 55076]SPL94073.1 unnamed protein product [Actinomadura parvosata subsp. kistnae]